MIVYDSDLKAFYSTKVNDDNVISGFCTRDAGDALQTSSIISYLTQTNINFKKIAIPEQIHSVNVTYFTPQSQGEVETFPDVDGIVTRENSVVLTVRTADCIPIVFADKVKGIIGISHHGWRGSLKKMAVKMVEKMIDIGSRKEDIIVAMGPSINQCCYDIDEDRYMNFMEELNGYSDKIFIIRQGKRYLNLPMLNYLLLVEAGITEKNIDFFPFCTKCDSERFFSLRRDGKQGLKEMLSFIIKI